MKYLGIDYGLKKIGLAIGSSDAHIAAPLEVLENHPHVMDELKELIVSEGIDEVVVGLPQSTGDHHSDVQIEVTQQFIQSLEGLIQKPVQLVDESYTSVESQRLQQEQGSNVPEDALSAMLILQSYLDGLERR